MHMYDTIRSIDPGQVNLGLCDFCPAQNKIVTWEVLTAPTIDSLFAALRARPFQGVVVIEAQSKKTNKMRAVQDWTQAFYVLQGLKVIIFSARNKLKGSGQENSGRGNYRARKKAAVALVTSWLVDHPQSPDLHTWFRQTKKKDDAADSLLQALAFAHMPLASSDSPITTKLVCRVPTTHQQQTGRYSQSNLKHIITKEWKCDSQSALADRLSRDKRVARAVQRQFKTIQQCWDAVFVDGTSKKSRASNNGAGPSSGRHHTVRHEEAATPGPAALHADLSKDEGSGQDQQTMD